MNQQKIVLAILKTDWTSYFQLISLLKSGSADRIVRHLRSKGNNIIDRWQTTTILGNKVRYKQFKLVEGETNA